MIGSILGTVATFLSTLSLRRATADALVIRRLPVISIHALLAESDRPARKACSTGPNFYPRSPCGERHGKVRIYDPAYAISIHALLAENDCQAP